MVGSRLAAQLRMADTLRRRQRLEEEEQRGSGTGGVSDIDSDRAVVNEEHMRRRIGQDKVQRIRKHPPRNACAICTSKFTFTAI